ncbi:MAG: thioesterase family protein [Kiloniellales bacterium]
MTHDAPLELYRGTVLPDWIDYNGHMNVAYYLMAFDQATDAFLDYLGLDDAHREASGGSTFAAETHITYLREVNGGAPLCFTTQLLGYDAKRLHYFNRMYHAEEGFLAATSEWLSLYIDLRIRRVAAMPGPIMARLESLMQAHRRLAPPPEAGRVIRTPNAPVA